MQVVERDFTSTGRMKPISDAADKKRVKGHLPFYSVDTQEEVATIIARALEIGEFVRNRAGQLVEATLAEEQTLERLDLAGERLAAIHSEIKDGV